jgi:hypothetical protein
MLRQEELAFIKAMSTLQLSPILRKLRLAMSWRKKKPLVPAGGCTTTSRSGTRAPERPSSQFVAKHKANELASSGNLMEPANRRLSHGTGSAPLPAFSLVTREQSLVMGEQAAFSSQQLVPP